MVVFTDGFQSEVREKRRCGWFGRKEKWRGGVEDDDGGLTVFLLSVATGRRGEAMCVFAVVRQRKEDENEVVEKRGERRGEDGGSARDWLPVVAGKKWRKREKRRGKGEKGWRRWLRRGENGECF
ncbi:hypothetical protein HAX54_042197 [Datura stramonium]|uniref:Uncharacterized protein n=1 Tax=Datura stramonium TaxID=4076 RepID=A0ABS8W3W1_DATST|nr:hypothetical protein [Datura stramonium]